MKKIIFLIYMLSYVAQSIAGHYYYKQIFLREGLPSRVRAILTDERGFVWIGTREGVYRFNGYELKKYAHENNTPNTLPSNSIVNIIEGKQHDLWIISEKGIALYEKDKDEFPALKDSTGNYIQAYSACSVEDGILFGSKGKFIKYDYQTRSFSSIQLNGKPNFDITSIISLDKNSILCSSRWARNILVDVRTGKIKSDHFTPDHEFTAMFLDSKRRIWIASYNNGIKCYSHNGKLLTSYTTQNSQLSNNTVMCIAESNYHIWIGTDGGGINILNPETQEITILKHTPGDDSSLPVNSITCFYNDGNTFWAGTIRGGLIGIKQVYMQTYTSALLGTDGGLSENTIRSLYQDNESTIWIGTDGGGINKFNPTTNKFKHLLSTWENKVSSITSFDANHLIFSCFNKGAFILDKKTENFRPFIIVNDSINKQLYHRGKSVNVYQNTLESILILTDCLYIYHMESHTFQQIKTENILGILLAIAKNADCTFLNDMKNIYTLNHQTLELTPLFSFSEASDTTINSVSKDQNGTFWIGTNQGLASYNPNTHSYSTYPTNLFTNAISVVCDQRGRVWVGSIENMLFSWSILEKKFIIYSESDGLSLNDYMNEPRLVSSNGDIYMGGVKGLLRIDKQLQMDASETYKLALDEIILDGEVIRVGENYSKLSFPWNSKSLTIKILSHEKDIFRNRIYRYHIKGPNERYTESYRPELKIHTFIPGDYSISVSCNTKTGDWTPDEQILSFTITPPWYQTSWFILTCVFMPTGVMVGGALITIKRKESKLKWAMKEHEKQVYEEKVRFLINISHELRTPLTLIYAPLKRILQSLPDVDTNYLQLKGVYNQAQRMRNIINMVLDVRKMEVGQAKLIIKPHLLNEWIHNISKDFELEASARDIKITYSLDKAITEVYFDENKCEIVIANLLSNALKYSSDHTEIHIVSQLITDYQRVRISVIDQGRGLEDVDINKLFTRFYQGQENLGGSGIGLSYAKLLVELHGGSIGAKENESSGSTFYFELPLKIATEYVLCEAKPYLNELINSGEELIEPLTSALYSTQNYSLLLVDDNKDLIAFLKESLKAQFKRLYTATDGIEANEITQKEQPDIIVSDIMMPRMDGYELCKRIKENIETSHIPIILLTARDDERSLLNGYKNGADAYISKPFDIEILLTQIRSILRNRESIRQRYLKAGVVPVSEETTFSNADEQFMIKLNKIIMEHLDNPQLDVLFLCNEIGMSRSSLYNKLKVLTSMGVNDYINKLKMEKAVSLMSTTDMTITEISDSIGFSTLRYFSTAFKQYTGKAPSVYKEDLKIKKG
ncbi:MAG: response regulator [Bacteroides sp.]|nr:response regulator [Bacteroides sp.]